jgi:hypothetical protein
LVRLDVAASWPIGLGPAAGSAFLPITAVRSRRELRNAAASHAAFLCLRVFFDFACFPLIS